jgi:hypothetical protein
MTKTEILEQLAAKQREYIAFVDDKNSGAILIASLHHWEAHPKDIAQGDKFRAEIAQLEKDIEKLSDPDDYVKGLAKIDRKDRAALADKLAKRTTPDWKDEGNFYVTIEGGDLFLNYVSDDGEYEHDYWLKPTIHFEKV